MVWKKELVEGVDVYSAALARMDELYDRFDKVAVSFSGGKDSTSAFQVALEVATARKRLPLDLYFFDEEAIHPETIEYVHRVADRDDVRLLWYAVPVKHRNACSRREPWWYCWDPDKRDLWVRDMPERALTTCPKFEKGMTMPECVARLYGPEHGTVAHIRGIRANESLSRTRSVLKTITDNWLSGPPGGRKADTKHVTMASPIYDWSTEDVWTATSVKGWDYNRAYDVFMAAGVTPNQQRVCPPYGEEPLRGLYQYAECWPELWHKMIARVPGAATAARYSQTELYGFGGLQLPEGKTWKSWFWDQVNLYGPTERQAITSAIGTALRHHDELTNSRPVPLEIPDSISGLSWKSLCVLAIRGDLKGRRVSTLSALATTQRDKLGITLEEAIAEAVNDGTRY